MPFSSEKLFQNPIPFKNPIFRLDTKIWFTNENAILEPKIDDFGFLNGYFRLETKFSFLNEYLGWKNRIFVSKSFGNKFHA